MRVRALMAAILCLLAAGCGASIDDIRRTADSLRDDTEKLAADSNARSKQREEEILAAAAEIRRREMPESNASRYELIKTANGYRIYDTVTGRDAVWHGFDQTGLSLRRAQMNLARMQAEQPARTASTGLR